MVRNAPFLKSVVPVLAASNASDSGPSKSFCEGIPGFFSESQLDILNDPAAKGLEAVLRVRERGGPSYPPLCHLRGRVSASGSESDLQEPIPTVFVDQSVMSVNPGVARASLVSGGVSRAAHACRRARIAILAHWWRE